MKPSILLNRMFLVPLIMVMLFLLGTKLGHTFTFFEGAVLTLMVDMLLRISDLQASHDALGHVLLADKTVKEVDLIRKLINAEFKQRDGMR